MAEFKLPEEALGSGNYATVYRTGPEEVTKVYGEVMDVTKFLETSTELDVLFGLDSPYLVHGRAVGLAATTNRMGKPI